MSYLNWTEWAEARRGIRKELVRPTEADGDPYGHLLDDLPDEDRDLVHSPCDTTAMTHDPITRRSMHYPRNRP